MNDLCSFYCIFSPKIWVKKRQFLHLSFFDFLERQDNIFQNCLWILKLVLYRYASFKKEISILSHIAKKLQTLEFLQNLLSKNAPGKKKCLGFLGKTGQFLPKLISNSKINCISTSFEKRISILSHIAKKLQAHQFLKNWVCKKAPSSKKVLLIFFFFIFLKLFQYLICHFNFESLCM